MGTSDPTTTDSRRGAATDSPLAPPSEAQFRATEDERVIIGACLRWPEVVLSLRERLTADDFYPGLGQEAFAAIEAVSNRAEPTILTSVAEELRIRGAEVELWSGAFLTECAFEVVTPAFLPFHALNVARAAQRRRLLQAGLRVEATARNAQHTADEAIQHAQEIIAGIATRGASTPAVLSPSDQGELAALLSAASEEDQALPFGLLDLDAKTLGGARRGQLIVIGGRTGMGKSALVRLIARSFAAHGATLFASNEMTAEQLIQRDAAVLGNIALQTVVQRHFTQAEADSLAWAEAEIANLALYTWANWGMSSASLRLIAREMHARIGLRAIVVDYLQKMTDPGRTDLERVGHATRELKSLALELNLPVVVGAQLNRQGEMGEDSNDRPTLLDLRSTGEIEQTADVVLLLYRANARYRAGQGKGDNTAELIIAKQRQGEAGTMVKVAWLPSLATFRNLSMRDGQS